MRRAVCALRRYTQCSRVQEGHRTALDIDKLLNTPTWSVASLLPPQEAQETTPVVTSKQLHHLLRLSALPPPQDEAEEQAMLKTLSSQLHFVKTIQNVDTTGVEPLRSLRDETAAGRKAATISLDTLKDAFAEEDTIGEYHKRIRRRRGQGTLQQEKWDVLGNAEKKTGRFFVVEGGKD